LIIFFLFLFLNGVLEGVYQVLLRREKGFHLVEVALSAVRDARVSPAFRHQELLGVLYLRRKEILVSYIIFLRRTLQKGVKAALVLIKFPVKG
jgi:hypothetical protein